jgi:SAM-dependent methyltransferase
MIDMLDLDETSMVAEIASNDGYLLQFVQAQKIPCFGVEPTASTAVAARAKGIETIEEFFGVELAERLVGEGKTADLIAANNVLAHVPDINDFVSGFATLLKNDGVATFEFPHLMKMVVDRQFDTIYHEHYSYLSFSTVVDIFRVNGLSVFNVEQIPTHGGSLRVFAQRSDTGIRPTEKSVTDLLALEMDMGMKSVDFYQGFEDDAEILKTSLLDFLLSSKEQSKKVAAYGAAAKGNTFLNYAGVKSDLISFVSDRNPAKQGKWMPGSHIPIVGEQQIKDEQPDFVLILPWNLQEEVSQQLSYIREWGAQFVVVQPNFRIW